jgi:hypothetical protein
MDAINSKINKINNNGQHLQAPMVTACTDTGSVSSPAGQRPACGQQWREVVLIGHRRQAGKHVAQICERDFAALPWRRHEVIVG